MSKTLLVDGDLLLYRFGFRAQTTIVWDEQEDIRTVYTEEDIAVDDMKSFLVHLQTTCKCEEMRICLTGKQNFRKDIMPSYKHNRIGNEKPVLYDRLKAYLRKHYCCLERKGLEADDLLGILSTQSPNKFIIASIDKDLKQIPGWHFNWKHDTRVRLVPKHEADQLFYCQCLAGDPTDGYSGCPKLGMVKALKIVSAVIKEHPKDWQLHIWPIIVEQYAKKGLDESYALMQARMARILRAEDFDMESNSPILWTPICAE